MEIWKNINENYLISNKGRVKSIKTNKLLAINYNWDGYNQIHLYKSRKTYRVNRLVALAFIENPLNLPEVNHKDGNKENDNVSNLEWCTHAENMQHAYDSGLQTGMKGIDNSQHILTEEQVKEIRDKYIPRIYSSIKLAREYDVSKQTILRIIHMKAWQHI